MPDIVRHDALEFKPDYRDTVKRYDAFWNFSLIDRPIVHITVPGADKTAYYEDNYYTRIHNDLDELVNGLIQNAGLTLFLGEALPQPTLSFGCDEIAALCGGQLEFNNDYRETNWSVPFVNNWEDAFPIRIDDGNPMWRRKLSYAEKCAAAMDGRMLFSPIDLLTNMDLMQGLRGAERLCTDLIDRPGTIDRALSYAMEIVDKVFNSLFKPYGLPAANGFDHLQCDFSYMIGGPMFRRFVLPYLELEAGYFNNRVVYHWDGPGALTHTEDLLNSKNIYLLSYVPGSGRGSHTDYLDLYQTVQSRGKAVAVWGSPEELKIMHKYLKPDKTVYSTSVKTRGEAEQLLEWFVKNT